MQMATKRSDFKAASVVRGEAFSGVTTRWYNLDISEDEAHFEVPEGAQWMGIHYDGELTVGVSDMELEDIITEGGGLTFSNVLLNRPVAPGEIVTLAVAEGDIGSVTIELEGGIDLPDPQGADPLEPYAQTPEV
jgi:hypothetical protein